MCSILLKELSALWLFVPEPITIENFNNGIQQGIQESFRLKDRYGID